MQKLGKWKKKKKTVKKKNRKKNERKNESKNGRINIGIHILSFKNVRKKNTNANIYIVAFHE